MSGSGVCELSITLAVDTYSSKFPRGSIYTTIMELGPKRPSPSWFRGPNSIIVVYMDPLGFGVAAGPKP